MDAARPAPPPYPVHLRIHGWTVVIVGAGQVATRKVNSLLESGARVRVIAPMASEDIAQLAADGILEWIPREYEPGDLDGARIAFAATNHTPVNEAVAAEARARAILLHRADDSAKGDFYNPAPFRTATILGSVQTLGVAPIAAAYVRRRLEEYARDELDSAVAVLVRLRQKVRDLPLSPSARGELLRAVLPLMITDLDAGIPAGDVLTTAERNAIEWLKQQGHDRAALLLAGEPSPPETAGP